MPEQERALLQATAERDWACHTATVLALNTTLRSDEIKQLRWEQIDLEKRSFVVGHSKTDAGEGRRIPLNVVAFEALARWAGGYPGAKPEHYVFPWCENRPVDPQTHEGMAYSVAKCPQASRLSLPVPRPETYRHHEASGRAG